jgi:adenine-specific DNA-methyltransferase
MRFIGCKENLIPFIETFIKQKDIKGNIFCDLFAGTAAVGKHFKRLGYKIISTDLLYFSYILQKVYIELNQYPKFIKLLKHLKIKPFEETLFTTESQNTKEKQMNGLQKRF